MPSKELTPLPPHGERLAGESSDNKENYSVVVSNASGYLCRLQATCHFPATPETVYAIFINTGESCSTLAASRSTLGYRSVACFADNTGVFRDIKTSGKREVLEEVPCGQGYRQATFACFSYSASHAALLLPKSSPLHLSIMHYKRCAPKTVAFVCNNCFVSQDSCPYIKLSLLRNTIAVKMQ